jgi:MYND finger protein
MDSTLLELFKNKFGFDFEDQKRREKYGLKILKKITKYKKFLEYYQIEDELRPLQNERLKESEQWDKIYKYFLNLIADSLDGNQQNEYLNYNPMISSVKGMIRDYKSKRMRMCNAKRGTYECGMPANKRCSQCRLHYCSRECQKTDWNYHRSFCSQVHNWLSDCYGMRFLIPEEIDKKNVVFGSSSIFGTRKFSLVKINESSIKEYKAVMPKNCKYPSRIPDSYFEIILEKKNFKCTFRKNECIHVLYILAYNYCIHISTYQGVILLLYV